MSSQSYLDAKTGPHGYGRFVYLQTLVTEFQDTDSAAARKEVLANLANFAYDPINYEHLRRLHVVDLFLDMLSEDDADLQEFGVSGLCNIALDPTSAKRICDNDGIAALVSCLSSSREETVMSAITALHYLLSPARRQQIASDMVVDCMERFSACANVRLSNLAKVFLESVSATRWFASGAFIHSTGTVFLGRAVAYWYAPRPVVARHCAVVQHNTRVEISEVTDDLRSELDTRAICENQPIHRQEDCAGLGAQEESQ